MVRADCQESAQRARQCEAGCHEHHDAKASHEGFVQILFERPSLLSNNLWGHLRFGQLRHLGIQSNPNFHGHLQSGYVRIQC